MKAKKPGPGPRRLLLLEFASRERWVYNSRYFPFIKGAAEALGIPCRWLCFGAELSTDKTGRAEVRQYRDLPPRDRALLRRQAASLRPTHVITSHPLSAAVRASLERAAGPGARWLALSDHPAAAGELTAGDLHRLGRQGRRAAAPPLPDRDTSALMARTDWLLDWLGEDARRAPERGKFLVGTFRPSYDAIMGNAAFRQNTPHIVIMGGCVCDHRKKLSANKLYWELDLSGGEDFGCGFCTYYRGPTSDPRADPVVVAKEQFLRVQATAGPEGRDCGIFDLWDIRLFRLLPRFFAMVRELGLGPSTFCFEPRIDRFLQSAEALERLLPGLARQGHKVSLLRMGAESLVESENEFYNKHISLAQIDAATRKLQDLSARFPETFSCDPTYGYISCSPWTTLEEFETGVRRARERLFDPKGIWLYTPLLLFRGSPLERLARAQGGILVGQPEDLSLLYEPAVNESPFAIFSPWRFKDERLAAAFALIVRFCAAALRGKYPDTLFAGDTLYRRMLERSRDEAFYARPDLFALEVIALVKASKPPYDRAALLDAALDRTAASGAEPEALPTQACGERERSAKLRFLFEALLRRFPARFTGLRLLSVRAAAEEGAIFVEFSAGSGRCALSLTDRATTPRWMFRTEHLAATCDPRTPVASGAQQKVLEDLVRLFDFALLRHAPELRPGPKPGP